jgi:hypothetical protein
VPSPGAGLGSWIEGSLDPPAPLLPTALRCQDRSPGEADAAKRGEQDPRSPLGRGGGQGGGLRGEVTCVTLPRGVSSFPFRLVLIDSPHRWGSGGNGERQAHPLYGGGSADTR